MKLPTKYYRRELLQHGVEVGHGLRACVRDGAASREMTDRPITTDLTPSDLETVRYLFIQLYRTQRMQQTRTPL